MQRKARGLELSPIGQEVLTVGRADVGGGAQDTNEYEPDEPGGLGIVIIVLDDSSETIELLKSLVRVAPSDDRSMGFQRWRDTSGCDERILCSFEKFFGGGSVSEFGPRDPRHERMRIDSPGLYPAVFGGNKRRAASGERIEDLDVAALRLLRDKVFGPGPAEARAVSKPSVNRKVHIADEAAGSTFLGPEWSGFREQIELSRDGYRRPSIGRSG